MRCRPAFLADKTQPNKDNSGDNREERAYCNDLHGTLNHIRGTQPALLMTGSLSAGPVESILQVRRGVKGGWGSGSEHVHLTTNQEYCSFSFGSPNAYGERNRAPAVRSGRLCFVCVFVCAFVCLCVFVFVCVFVWSGMDEQGNEA